MRCFRKTRVVPTWSSPFRTRFTRSKERRPARDHEPPALAIDRLHCGQSTREWYQSVPLFAVWYHLVPMSRAKDSSDSTAMRERILTAAFETFHERGYAATSTLEIATRARVSKRDLYALVGNKEQMLMAAIGDRARRLRAPADMPTLRDRATLAWVLTAF